MRVLPLYLPVTPIPAVQTSPALSFGSSSDLEVRSVLLQFAVVHVHGEKLKQAKSKSILNDFFSREALKNLSE